MCFAGVAGDILTTLAGRGISRLGAGRILLTSIRFSWNCPNDRAGIVMKKQATPIYDAARIAPRHQGPRVWRKAPDRGRALSWPHALNRYAR